MALAYDNLKRIKVLRSINVKDPPGFHPECPISISTQKNNLYPELLGDIPRRGPHLVFFKYSRDPS
jgi:hypothetical protein